MTSRQYFEALEVVLVNELARDICPEQKYVDLGLTCQ